VANPAEEDIALFGTTIRNGSQRMVVAGIGKSQRLGGQVEFKNVVAVRPRLIELRRRRGVLRAENDVETTSREGAAEGPQGAQRRSVVGGARGARAGRSRALVDQEVARHPQCGGELRPPGYVFYAVGHQGRPVQVA